MLELLFTLFYIVIIGVIAVFCFTALMHHLNDVKQAGKIFKEETKPAVDKIKKTLHIKRE